MNVFEAILQRREITNFLDKDIPVEVLEKLLDAAYLAPSGNNLPSREFILVTDRETLNNLSETTPYVSWLSKAKAAIAVTGRPDLSKYWIQDASIACGHIWLTAVDQGIGLAFGAVYHSEDGAESAFRESFVRKMLSIPDHHRVISILGLGFPEKYPEPKNMYPREQVIHRGKYIAGSNEQS